MTYTGKEAQELVNASGYVRDVISQNIKTAEEVFRAAERFLAAYNAYQIMLAHADYKQLLVGRDPNDAHQAEGHVENERLKHDQ